jgi:hypothetical protein
MLLPIQPSSIAAFGLLSGGTILAAVIGHRSSTDLRIQRRPGFALCPEGTVAWQSGPRSPGLSVIQFSAHGTEVPVEVCRVHLRGQNAEPAQAGFVTLDRDFNLVLSWKLEN